MFLADTFYEYKKLIKKGRNTYMGASDSVKITLNQIQMGMISSENVYNSSGLLLIGKDEAITQTHLFRLKLYQIFSLDVYMTDDFIMENNSSNISKENNRFEKDLQFQEFKKLYLDSCKELQNQIHIFSETNNYHEEELYSTCTNLLLHLTSYSKLFVYLSLLATPKDIDSIFTHSLNVGLLCNIFGHWLQLNETEIKEVTLSGLTHDIGKIDIDPLILHKPGRLTSEEFEIIKSHPLHGFERFRHTSLPYGVKMAILQHHEKLDGSGYPFGFQQDHIHNYAKIVAIADIYDAMTSNRTYHKRMQPIRVIDILEKEGSNVLDSKILSVFLEHMAIMYTGKSVLLSSGDTGKIVFINRKSPARPLVQVGSKIYNLEFETSLEIIEVY